MGINIRQKGADAERDVAKALNNILFKLMRELGYEDKIPAFDIIQRNQNQSAVGGKDLSNTFELAIEVKRQEDLSIGSWWKQCVAEAERNNERPVLIFRQSRKPWRVITMAEIAFWPSSGAQHFPVEMRWDDFLTWFESYVRRRLNDGVKINV